jgi:hypothetical protein
MGSPCAPDDPAADPSLLPAVPRGKRRRRPDVDPVLGMTLSGSVSLSWPHRDGLIWPHRRHAGAYL